MISAKHIIAIVVVGTLLYSGPAAACRCAEHQVAMIACCPDSADSEHQHGHSDPVSDEEVSTACAPVGGDALSGGSLKLPDYVAAVSDDFAAIVATTPYVQRAFSHVRPLAHGPPIYLTTQRFRI